MPVVDATVLADLHVGDAELTEAAKRLALDDPHWISTGLWQYEFGNVILRYTRCRNLDPSLVLKFLETARAMVVETVHEMDDFAIFKIASETNLSYYDASYVWLARSRRLKLVTRDRKILTSCSDVAVSMPGVIATF